MKKQFSGLVDYIDNLDIVTIKLENTDNFITIPLDCLPSRTQEGDYIKFTINPDPDLMRSLQYDEQYGGYIKKAPIQKFRETS